MDVPEVNASLMKELRRAGAKRAQRRAAAAEATAELRALVIVGAQAGMSEMALVEATGVARRTIRMWLGKSAP